MVDAILYQRDRTARNLDPLGPTTIRDEDGKIMYFRFDEMLSDEDVTVLALKYRSFHVVNGSLI